ncbi:MAG: sterol desaturase family protein [Sneathiella sp.]|nr:sterol desaturase family protein [Sneathiella sp.]
MFEFSAWLGFVAHDILKYLIPAGFVFFVTRKLFAKAIRGRRIQKVEAGRHQIIREICWSLVSATIFASVSMVGVMGLSTLGINQVYFDISDYGWGYAIFSLVLMILAHDTYFYWTHRLMHLPAVLRYTHLLHHRSRTTTPWTAYSFDPVEAFVQVAFAALFALLIPLNPLILLIWSLHMVIRNVIGHCGFELYPRTMARSRWFGWISGVTHHDLHHQNAKWNFGLYFTWWDRLMGTEHPEYLMRFDRAVGLAKEDAISKGNNRVAE